MTNKNKRLSGIFIVGCLLAVGVAVAAELASSGIFGSKHTICEGVKIGKVEVGGMTKAEAENAVDDHIAGLLSRKVVIQIGENELETDFESLGMHFSEEKLIDQAYAVGKKGNLIKRMREVENAHQSGKTFALKYSFDEQKLKEYVEKECTQFDVKAKNSKLSLKNGRFVASKERTGRELQVDKRSIVSARRCRKQTSRISIRYRRLWRQQSQSTRRKWYRNAKICWDVIQRLMQHQRRHVRRMYRRRPEGSMEQFYIRAKHFPRSR